MVFAAYMRDNGATSFLVLVPRRFIGHRLAELIGADARTAFQREPLRAGGGCVAGLFPAPARRGDVVE